MISLGVIITSVTCLCAETVFDSECDDTGCHEMEVPPGFATTELICIIWFTTEYLLRFLASRNKCKFLKNTMNVIDKLAIAPFYITAIVKLMNPDGGGGGPFAIVRVIRLIRIFRVFKLGKHSSGLVVLTRTVRLPPPPPRPLLCVAHSPVLLRSDLGEYERADAAAVLPRDGYAGLRDGCVLL